MNKAALKQLEAARSYHFTDALIWIGLVLINILVDTQPNLVLAIVFGVVAIIKLRTVSRIDHAIALRSGQEN